VTVGVSSPERIGGRFWPRSRRPSSSPVSVSRSSRACGHAVEQMAALAQHLASLGMALLDDAADLRVDLLRVASDTFFVCVTEWPRKTSCSFRRSPPGPGGRSCPTG
jgi:hypothetical protein